MTDIKSVLAERGARYGDFTDHAAIAQAIQDIIRNSPSWDKMNPVMKQSLTVIADKIARICSGDPSYDDNWIDLQGYAKLVQDRLGKTVPTTKYEITIPKPVQKEAKEMIKKYLYNTPNDIRRAVGGTVITNDKTFIVGESPSESYVTTG